MASKTREELIAALDGADVGSVVLKGGGLPLNILPTWKVPGGWLQNRANVPMSSAALANFGRITHLIPASALAQYAIDLAPAGGAKETGDATE